jgi:hypothetical protein
MRVADLPPDHRRLSAYLANFRHHDSFVDSRNPKYIHHLQHYQGRVRRGGPIRWSALGAGLPQDAVQIVEQRASVVGLDLMKAAMELLDATKNERCVTGGWAVGSPSCFSQGELQRANQPLCRKGSRPMLVNDASLGGLEGCGEGHRGLRHVAVNERLQDGRLMTPDRRAYNKK